MTADDDFISLHLPPSWRESRTHEHAHYMQYCAVDSAVHAGIAVAVSFGTLQQECVSSLSALFLHMQRFACCVICAGAHTHTHTHTHSHADRA
jgi:hypothetical protein